MASTWMTPEPDVHCEQEGRREWREHCVPYVSAQLGADVFVPILGAIAAQQGVDVLEARLRMARDICARAWQERARALTSSAGSSASISPSDMPASTSATQ
eukprot:579465-Pyramimonas_sp.AAC.1